MDPIIITKGIMAADEEAAYIGFYTKDSSVRVCTDKDTQGHYKELQEAPDYVQDAMALVVAWATDDLHEETMQDIQAKVAANIVDSMPTCTDCEQPFKRSEIVTDDAKGDNATLCVDCRTARRVQRAADAQAEEDAAKAEEEAAKAADEPTE